MLAAWLLLAGCGFHLRAPQPLPFDSIHVGMPDSSELGAALKRSIRTSGRTRVVEDPRQAQALLTVVGEGREKVILSLNAAGRVREFQLRYSFAFKVQDAQGREILPQNRIVLTRDYTFNDETILAKEQEEALLYADMQKDLVQQIVRRLAAASPGAS
jgi:LPS-assembly lipoprotein